MPNTEIEMLAGEPEEGDVYCSKTGEHLGNIAIDPLVKVPYCLFLQVKVGDNWYVYQLCEVTKLGEEDAGRTD